MSFRVCFPFTLASGASLAQDSNIDLPNFRTRKGISVTISNMSGSGPVAVCVGTVLSNVSPVGPMVPWDNEKYGSTSNTVYANWPDFVWDYTCQEVRVLVTNLDTQTNNYVMSIVSDEI